MSIFTPRPRLNLVSASLFVAAEAGWILLQMAFVTSLTLAIVYFYPMMTDWFFIILLGIVYACNLNLVGKAILRAFGRIWDMVGSIREELTDRQVNG